MKKGFTLVELLAVIVILAIIALIVSPIVTTTIAEANRGTSTDSVYGYVKAVEVTAANLMSSDTPLQDGTYEIKNGGIYLDGKRATGVRYNGTSPSDGGTITLKGVKVTSAEMKMGNYYFEYDGRVVREVKK